MTDHERARLDSLAATFRPVALEVIARTTASLERQGVDLTPYVVDGRRTVQQQREKVRRGQSRTMKSLHLVGKAMDLTFARDGVPLWTKGRAHTWPPDLFAAFATYHHHAEALGLRTLGLTWDPYHCEWTERAERFALAPWDGPA